MFSAVPICSSICEHGLVGATVRRAPQRGDAGRDRRVGIGRAAGKAHGRGAAVLLMVGVQNEQQVERLCRHRIDLIVRCGDGKQHVQEISGVGQIVARVGERLAYVCL